MIRGGLIIVAAACALPALLGTMVRIFVDAMRGEPDPAYGWIGLAALIGWVILDWIKDRREAR